MGTYNPKPTQGQEKMKRYINELVRNEDFLRLLKNLKSDEMMPAGYYDTWTKEEQCKHDYINKELGEIIQINETIRKRCKKLFNDNFHRTKQTISEDYFLDLELIGYADDASKKKQSLFYEEPWSLMDIDVCKIFDFRDDELNPFNKGDEIIYLNFRKKLFLNAYPIAICINPSASKRDVLDFIDKRWEWIEGNFLRFYTEKQLKYRKRKYSQSLLDFLWDNRNLTQKQIKKMLDEKFPNNGVVYYEISKLISLERKKRLGNLT